MVEQVNKEYRLIKPFKTLEELEESVALLEHWTVPGELSKYLEILYRLTAFDITGRYKIHNAAGGYIEGKYNSDIRKAALEICRTKFPVDIWEYPEGQLSRVKEGYPQEVGYLANYAASEAGLNFVVERTYFVETYESENNCKLDDSMTLEEIKLLEESAQLYLETKKHKR